MMSNLVALIYSFRLHDRRRERSKEPTRAHAETQPNLKRIEAREKIGTADKE